MANPTKRKANMASFSCLSSYWTQYIQTLLHCYKGQVWVFVLEIIIFILWLFWFHWYLKVWFWRFQTFLMFFASNVWLLMNFMQFEETVFFFSFISQNIWWNFLGGLISILPVTSPSYNIAYLCIFLSFIALHSVYVSEYRALVKTNLNKVSKQKNEIERLVMSLPLCYCTLNYTKDEYLC